MSPLSASQALGRVLRPGQTIVIGQGFGTPRTLVAALADHVDKLRGSRLIVGWVLGDFPRLPGATIETFFPSGPFATEKGMRERDATYLRRSLFEMAAAFRDGDIRVDVALALATPARAGRHSLGITVDFIKPAVDAAAAVVLETSPKVPWTGDRSAVAPSGELLVVDSLHGPTTVPPVTAAANTAIAENLLDWIPDGASVEFGIGGLLEPVIASFAGRRRGLRLHCGGLGPWLFPLIDSGTVDVGDGIVGATASGTQDFYDRLADHGSITLAPASHTHAPERLRALSSFRAINSVLEVDISGNANSEYGAGGRRGGYGGLRDFASAASSVPDGLSILVLSATHGSGSRIVPAVLSREPTLRGDEVDVVVTEYGSAFLRGRDPGERAAALIATAAPEYREALRCAANSASDLGEGRRRRGNLFYQHTR